MTEQSGLDLTFLRDCLVPSCFSASPFKFGVSTYGYPEEKIPDTIVAQIKTYANSWLPLIKFRDAADYWDLDKIKSLDLDNCDDQNHGWFSALDIEDRAIIHFDIMIQDSWGPAQTLKSLEANIIEDVSTEKMLSFNEYSRRIYWLQIKKRPIEDYHDVHDVLTQSQQAYKRYKDKIDELQCEHNELVKSHQQLGQTFVSTDILERSIERCLDLVAEEESKENQSKCEKVSLIGSLIVYTEEEKQKRKAWSQCHKLYTKCETEISSIAEEIKRLNKKQKRLTELRNRLQVDKCYMSIYDLNGKIGPPFSLIREKEKEEEKQHINKPRYISIRCFPDRHHGPFYVTGGNTPRTVLVLNHKVRKVLGINRLGTTSNVFPLTADQRHYWKSMNIEEFGPKPIRGGTPINWYSEDGSIKEEYKDKWKKTTT